MYKVQGTLQPGVVEGAKAALEVALIALYSMHCTVNRHFSSSKKGAGEIICLLFSLYTNCHPCDRIRLALNFVLTACLHLWKRDST